MTSHNPKDEAHRYCGNCHVFVDDPDVAEAMTTARLADILKKAGGELMSGILLLGETEAAAIIHAVERARRNPIPWAELKKQLPIANQATHELRIQDRNPRAPRRREAELIEIPVGYRLAISCEEQPAGMCLHMSMSSSTPGKVPSPEAFGMVLRVLRDANVLDLTIPPEAGRIWFEDFLIGDKVGGKAINVVWVIEPRKEGTA
jgi:hypothetical protein